MNPYDSHLSGRDPLEVIESTAERLRSVVERPSPAPGKWSTREILCHLADTEIVFAFRLRQALAETHHVIQPFDQDQWASNYGAYTTAQALGLFTAVRAWNILLIRQLPPEALSRKLTHPERGEMTFQVLLETMAGHDLNHLAQIQ